MQPPGPERAGSLLHATERDALDVLLLEEEEEEQHRQHGLAMLVAADRLDRARLAKDDTEKYALFWKEFGAVLKEGVVQDQANQAAILNLLEHPNFF